MPKRSKNALYIFWLSIQSISLLVRFPFFTCQKMTRSLMTKYVQLVSLNTLKEKYCVYSNTKLTIRRDVVRKISKVTREKPLGIILPK